LEKVEKKDLMMDKRLVEAGGRADKGIQVG